VAEAEEAVDVEPLLKPAPLELQVPEVSAEARPARPVLQALQALRYRMLLLEPPHLAEAEAVDASHDSGT